VLIPILYCSEKASLNLLLVKNKIKYYFRKEQVDLLAGVKNV